MYRFTSYLLTSLLVLGLFGAPGSALAAAASGSLSISVDAATPVEDIVVAGSTDVEVSSFRFTTTVEPFIVESLVLNNRQEGILASNRGQYDNNVSSVTLEYLNSSGASETSKSLLVDGAVYFSGLDFYIDANSEATLTVKVDLNPIGPATAGELVELRLSLADFEAIGQTSGVTFKEERLDNSYSSGMDLDIGSLRFSNGDNRFELDSAQDPSGLLGVTESLVIDDGMGDNLTALALGTLLCVDDNRDGRCIKEDRYVVSSWPNTAANTEESVVMTLVDDAGDDLYDDDDPLLYAQAGVGYLTSVNPMHVYEGKPTLRTSAMSPSGSRSTDHNDDAFLFDLAAEGTTLSINPAVDFTGNCSADAAASVTVVNSASISNFVDGSSCELTSIDSAGDSVLYSTQASTLGTSDLNDYKYASFWFRWTDVSGTSTSLTPDELRFFTADTGDGTEDQESTVETSNILASPSYLPENVWYFIKDVPMPIGTDGSDKFVGVSFHDSNALASGDTIYIDQVRLYNQKLEVNIASDADFDTSFDDGSGGTYTPVHAYLKDRGTVVAEGYVDMASTSLAVVTFVPTTTHGSMQVAPGTQMTYTVNLSTTNLLSDDAGVEDPVTFSINLGSSNNGQVTPGTYWWSEGNRTAQWVGNVTQTTLSGNTVLY